ncbi:MAG: twitching motility protein PilT [Lachnospiraceae bacterium]|nr:twitching motility protein PilT [Lachnospiraceae bacterium]
MVQLIIGNKGRGKTRYLLEKVNSEVKDTLGNICYLDKSAKHMFELNNRVRLINVSDFAIENTDQFIGFICGIISQDHDLEQMYFDSFLKTAHLEGQDITAAIKRIQKIGDMFGVTFIISISMDESEVPEELKELIIISL